MAIQKLSLRSYNVIINLLLEGMIGMRLIKYWLLSTVMMLGLMVAGCSNADSGILNKGSGETAKANAEAAEGTSAKQMRGTKVLVAYFSWSGNTRKIADLIHTKVGGDIFEIKTVQPYPKE